MKKKFLFGILMLFFLVFTFSINSGSNDITITTDKVTYNGLIEDTVFFNLTSSKVLKNVSVSFAFTEGKGVVVNNFYEVKNLSHNTTSSVSTSYDCTNVSSPFFNGTNMTCVSKSNVTKNEFFMDLEEIIEPVELVKKEDKQTKETDNVTKLNLKKNIKDAQKTIRPSKDYKGRPFIEDGNLFNLDFEMGETKQFAMSFNHKVGEGEFDIDAFDNQGNSIGFLDPFWNSSFTYKRVLTGFNGKNQTGILKNLNNYVSEADWNSTRIVENETDSSTAQFTSFTTSFDGSEQGYGSSYPSSSDIESPCQNFTPSETFYPSTITATLQASSPNDCLNTHFIVNVRKGNTETFSNEIICTGQNKIGSSLGRTNYTVSLECNQRLEKDINYWMCGKRDSTLCNFQYTAGSGLYGIACSPYVWGSNTCTTLHPTFDALMWINGSSTYNPTLKIWGTSVSPEINTYTLYYNTALPSLYPIFSTEKGWNNSMPYATLYPSTGNVTISVGAEQGQNEPPALSSFIMTPNPLIWNSVIDSTVDITDIEDATGLSVRFEIWKNKINLTGSGNTQSSLNNDSTANYGGTAPATPLPKGYEYNVTVFGGDGTDWNTTGLSIVRIVQNTPPTDSDVTDTSSTSTATNVGSDIKFSATITDPDNDDQVALLVCDSSGRTGTSCSATQFCRSPTSGFQSEGLTSCNYTTSLSAWETTYTAFFLDNTTGNVTATLSDDKFYTNHYPVITYNTSEQEVSEATIRYGIVIDPPSTDSTDWINNVNVVWRNSSYDIIQNTTNASSTNGLIWNDTYTSLLAEYINVTIIAVDRYGLTINTSSNFTITNNPPVINYNKTFYSNDSTPILTKIGKNELLYLQVNATDIDNTNVDIINATITMPNNSIIYLTNFSTCQNNECNSSTFNVSLNGRYNVTIYAFDIYSVSDTEEYSFIVGNQLISIISTFTNPINPYLDDNTTLWINFSTLSYPFSNITTTLILPNGSIHGDVNNTIGTCSQYDTGYYTCNSTTSSYSTQEGIHTYNFTITTNNGNITSFISNYSINPAFIIIPTSIRTSMTQTGVNVTRNISIYDANITNNISMRIDCIINNDQYASPSYLDLNYTVDGTEYDSNATFNLNNSYLNFSTGKNVKIDLKNVNIAIINNTYNGTCMIDRLWNDGTYNRTNTSWTHGVHPPSGELTLLSSTNLTCGVTSNCLEFITGITVGSSDSTTYNVNNTGFVNMTDVNCYITESWYSVSVPKNTLNVGEVMTFTVTAIPTVTGSQTGYPYCNATASSFGDITQTGTTASVYTFVTAPIVVTPPTGGGGGTIIIGSNTTKTDCNIIIEPNITKEINNQNPIQKFTLKNYENASYNPNTEFKNVEGETSILNNIALTNDIGTILPNNQKDFGIQFKGGIFGSEVVKGKAILTLVDSRCNNIIIPIAMDIQEQGFFVGEGTIIDQTIRGIQQPVSSKLSWLKIWMVLLFFSILYAVILWNREWSEDAIINFLVKTIAWIFIVIISTTIIIVLIRVLYGI